MGIKAAHPDSPIVWARDVAGGGCPGGEWCVCRSQVGSCSNVNSDSPQCCHKIIWLISVFFSQIYELRVMETKPDKAVSIIECDMNVSGFAAYSVLGPEQDG